MRGFISLPALWGSSFRMYGGPYRQMPKGMTGVKMAEEINLPCTVDIPTRDYCVPDLKTMEAGLEKTVNLILQGKPVYAGCMGGIGRTGLILALVAKAWGIDDPVTYVRTNYYSHAVETAEQQKYVADFKIPYRVTYMIWLTKWMNSFSIGKILTNSY